MGLNHFLPVPFLKVAPKDSQVFTAWDALPEYHQFLHAFYATQDNTQSAKLLEDFLLSVYRPFPEYEVLQEALTLLTQFDEELPVEEIAQRLKLNPRTFHRLFKKHMGISPVGYRKVARFRHSLNNKLVDAQFKKLTELGYASNFYDQAYFNKVYKQFTGSNPSTFFNSIDTMAEDKLIFQFLKEKDNTV
ncbi:helix-turn-helix domain-containing protein [Nibribacter ruber]|uniref:Helix-turn-helix domain-containing protein n=1 Tax=Nibribacter ruber TaxID=2698458 RepID=A0A6P1NZI9_9BACT|nr:helix-turn-helix domain-containing protein [Nibribacter ruber]QHL87904.1 helix-turn-helix domain-containing protein [Nibribacter ruber]